MAMANPSYNTKVQNTLIVNEIFRWIEHEELNFKSFHFLYLILNLLDFFPGKKKHDQERPMTLENI